MPAQQIVAFYSRGAIVKKLREYREEFDKDCSDTPEVEIPLYNILADLCEMFDMDEDEWMEVMGFRLVEALDDWQAQTVIVSGNGIAPRSHPEVQ
jgi:hypothetical protein